METGKTIRVCNILSAVTKNLQIINFLNIKEQYFLFNGDFYIKKRINYDRKFYIYKLIKEDIKKYSNINFNLINFDTSNVKFNNSFLVKINPLQRNSINDSLLLKDLIFEENSNIFLNKEYPELCDTQIKKNILDDIMFTENINIEKNNMKLLIINLDFIIKLTNVKLDKLEFNSLLFKVYNEIADEDEEFNNTRFMSYYQLFMCYKYRYFILFVPNNNYNFLFLNKIIHHVNFFKNKIFLYNVGKEYSEAYLNIIKKKGISHFSFPDIKNIDIKNIYTYPFKYPKVEYSNVLYFLDKKFYINNSDLLKEINFIMEEKIEVFKKFNCYDIITMTNVHDNKEFENSFEHYKFVQDSVLIFKNNVCSYLSTNEVEFNNYKPSTLSKIIIPIEEFTKFLNLQNYYMGYKISHNFKNKKEKKNEDLYFEVIILEGFHCYRFFDYDRNDKLKILIKGKCEKVDRNFIQNILKLNENKYIEKEDDVLKKFNFENLLCEKEFCDLKNICEIVAGSL